MLLIEMQNDILSGKQDPRPSMGHKPPLVVVCISTNSDRVKLVVFCSNSVSKKMFLLHLVHHMFLSFERRLNRF